MKYKEMECLLILVRYVKKELNPVYDLCLANPHLLLVYSVMVYMSYSPSWHIYFILILCKINICKSICSVCEVCNVSEVEITK